LCDLTTGKTFNCPAGGKHHPEHCVVQKQAAALMENEKARRIRITDTQVNSTALSIQCYGRYTITSLFITSIQTFVVFLSGNQCKSKRQTQDSMVLLIEAQVI